MLVQETRGRTDSRLAFGTAHLQRIGLEGVGHALVWVEYGVLAGIDERTIEPDEVAEENLAGAALDQGGRKPRSEVGIDRRNLGVPVVLCIGVGQCGIGQVQVIAEAGVDCGQRYVGVADGGDIRPRRL